MKYIITILSFCAIKANATIYYVSNAGSDAANGTTTGTTWQTLSKVNSSVGINDTVYFKGGDTFTGRLNIIGKYYGSYGTGKAIITGYENVTGFTQNGNIWRKLTGINKNINNVLINGLPAIKGRSPNSGYSTFSSYSGDSIINTSLTGTPSYVGKEITVRTTTWVIDVTRVLTQSTGQLKLLPKLTYTPQFLGNGYFFQNDSSFVDSLREYSFDSTTGKLIVYSTTSPTVYVASADTVIYFQSKSNITLSNLNITGANIMSVCMDTCNNITVSNCTVNYSGAYGLKGRKTRDCIFSGDTVLNCLSNSIFFRSDNPNSSMFDTCNNNYFNNIYIKNTALYAGMGLSGDDKYIISNVVGNGNKFNNIMADSGGYIGLRWQGKDTFTNCSVSNVNLVKSDGGAFYSWLGVGYPTNYDSLSYFKNCIGYNSYGYAPGTTGNVFGIGFYFDDLVRNVTLDSCSFFNSTHAMFLHNASAITATNTILDDSLGYCLWVAGTGAGSSFKHNVYYQRNSANRVAYFDNAGLSMTSDSNIIGRPTLQTSVMQISGSAYTFPGTWTSSAGYDSHSTIIPTAVSSNVGLMTYNSTATDASNVLAGSYLSGRNFGYTDIIYLPPFKAELLFKANFNGGVATNSFILR